MKKITLDQFCMHWVGGDLKRPNTRIMATTLEFNVEDFVTSAGEWSKSRFKSSFAEGGFYGSGTKWPVRQSKWGKKFTHPTMIDTGKLKDNIKGEKGKLGVRGGYGKSSFRRNYSYVIKTNEISTPTRGKRGSRNRRTGHNNYAAIHNTDPKFGLYTVNQYSSKRPEHRQFIGFSPKLNSFINTYLVPKIFDGFPK